MTGKTLKMSNKIKSGKEVIDEFFDNLKNLEGVDEATIKKIIELHEMGKLTDANLSNALSDLRGAMGED